MPVQLAAGRARKRSSRQGGHGVVASLSNNRKTAPFVSLAPKGRIRKRTVTINKETVKKETKKLNFLAQLTYSLKPCLQPEVPISLSFLAQLESDLYLILPYLFKSSFSSTEHPRMSKEPYVH